MIHLPVLSNEDPVEMSEGSRDPLGLSAIADSLANQLAPGVNEGNDRLRLLTATAVSLAVCGDFHPDEVCAVCGSPPWQVFEWFLVTALSREPERNRGLPGMRKAQAALREGRPLSARSYLKNASNTGFHGGYRTFSRTLNIERDGLLGETGYALVRVWELDQHLPGFADGIEGVWRPMISNAIRDSLDKGFVSRRANWEGWRFFTEFLTLDQPGLNEGAVLSDGIQCDSLGFRGELWDYLYGKIDSSGLDAIAPTERELYDDLSSLATPELRTLLECISAYEIFARRLQDAFDECLLEMTRLSFRRAEMGDLETLPNVRRATDSTREFYIEALERLRDYGESARFEQTFGVFGEPYAYREFVQVLLAHHAGVQSRKQSEGKAPWFDRFDDGSCWLRPAYCRSDPISGDDKYVHRYRSAPMIGLIVDARMAS